jgi:hypothetical protein
MKSFPRCLRFFLLLLGLAVSLQSLSAATYYIDFENGRDANTGLSPASPWQRHPYMTGWSGTYTHAAGDRFIFKGGVTWPRSTLPLTVAAGGSSTAGNDYYGIDPTWFRGPAWSRPVFDGEYLVGDCIKLGSRSYITIDNLELKRVTSSANFGYGLISGGAPSHILIDNCYLHGWRTTNARDDAHGGVIFSNQSAEIETVVIDRTEIENLENALIQWNGVCVRAVGTIRRSKIHDNSSGVLFCLDFDRSELYNIDYPRNSFDPTYHTNGIYLDPTTLGKSRAYIRNSYLYNSGGGANLAYPNVRAGATVYVYNNVIYGSMSAQLAIQIDPYNYANEGPGSCYVWNNTIVNFYNNTPAIRVVGRATKLGALIAENNHVIGIGASVTNANSNTTTSLVVNSNLVQTPTNAAAAGYTLASRYAPAVLSPLAATLDAGTSNPSVELTADITDLPRPQGAKWDIGAYEIGQAAPSILRQPNNAAVVADSGTTSITAWILGQAPLALQWQISLDQGGTWSNVTDSDPFSGVQTAQLAVVRPAISYNGALFRCRATNLRGTLDTDTVTLTVVRQAPSIQAQPPPSQTVIAFDFAQIRVVADGDPAPTFQWRRNGVDVAGATDSVLTFPVVTTADAGSYSVLISNGMTVTSSNSFLTVQKASQQLLFPTVASVFIENPVLDLGVAATSGLSPVVEVLSGPATVTGNALTVVSTGTVTLRASQPGNSNYNPASPIEQSFAVDSLIKQPQVIMFDALPARVYGDAPFSLTAIASSGLPVAYVSSNPAIASIDGNVLTIRAAGTVSILAKQDGNADFNPAAPVTQSLVIRKADQTISFDAIPTKTYRDAPFALRISTSSGLPHGVVMSPSPSSVARIDAGVVTILGTGSVTFSAFQSGNSNYNIARSVSRTLTVNKAPQTITFPALPDTSFSAAPIVLAATSSSGLAVTYTVVQGPVTLAGSTLTMTNTGSVLVRASQAGNANYLAASPVERAFTILDGFESWRNLRFTPAELADPAVSGPNAVFGQDGLTNQTKYALGLEPKTNTVTGQPVIANSASEWTYSYSRPDPAPTGLSDYTVEVSTDLRGDGSWTTAGVTHEMIGSAGGVANWRARFPLRSALNPTAARTVAFRLRTTLGANLSYAPPLAGITTELPLNQSTTFGLPLAEFPSGSGAVFGRLSDAGTNFVESGSAGWTPGAFSDPAAPYFLRIRTGSSTGRVLPVTNTGNTDSRLYIDTDGVTLAQSGVALGANGDAYEILPAETLASTFGGVGLTGASSAGAADLVQVWSGASWLVFYFNSDRNRWERNTDTAASPSRDTFVLRPDRGVLVQRRGTGPAILYLQHFGRVPEFAPRYFHARPGTTFVSTGVPADLTLAGFNSHLGVGVAGGWIPAATPAAALANADLVLAWSSTANRWRIHYFDSTNSRWQEAADATNTDRNGVVIPAGQAVILRRLGTSDNKLITLPLPYTVLQ